MEYQKKNLNHAWVYNYGEINNLYMNWKNGDKRQRKKIAGAIDMILCKASLPNDYKSAIMTIINFEAKQPMRKSLFRKILKKIRLKICL